ncbi:MAG: TetR/AcrR family transcriptional regulator [Actinobacteria bacterium]|nr:TetR/AcrR family transcriptional regulator [Actinomycetota bacterium]
MPEPSGSTGRSSAEHIRDAALNQFAAHGVSGTSLRAVAAAAGVSLGRVQHHYRTKARLVQAVDGHVLSVMRASLPDPATQLPADPVGDFGQHVVALIIEHPAVMNYLGRALIEGSEIGSLVFDNLARRGLTRWENLVGSGLARADLDLTWASLNPIILTLAALLLSPHIDRQLPEPFTTATQLLRWEEAVSAMIRRGQLLPAADPTQR